MPFVPELELPAKARALKARDDRLDPDPGRDSRALFLLGLPAQHLDQGAGGQPRRWPASAATSWRPGWTARPSSLTQMGGEGVQLDSAASLFAGKRHMFQNMGEGTYYHSGSMAIRAGDGRRGQHHLQDPLQRRGGDDRRPAGRRADQRAAPSRIRCAAEGVARIALVTDEPDTLAMA